MALNHPWGAIATVTLNEAGAQAVTISADNTIVDGVTTQATSNRTINLTVGSEVAEGAVLLVKSKSAGSQTVTFGTSITAPVSTGSAAKTITQSFMYDGSNFIATGAEQQID